MKHTFIDTSFLIALMVADDVHHQNAMEWRKAAGGPLLSTEYVFIEFFDAMVVEPARPLALRAVALLRQDRRLTIIPASTSLMDDGIAFFSGRSDKTWGLTDCISFVVMQRFDATDALTADRHFEQAGFRAMLLQKPPDH